MSNLPKTLAEAIRVYSDEAVAFELVKNMRWSNGVTCPRCGSDQYSFISTRQLWKCKGCKKQFSVKVGTIFEDSPIKLGMWLTGIWLITNAKNGISSHEISRSLGITQKTAWFMLHRIRLAMTTGSFVRLSGEVEADETFIGGKRSNMHKSRKVATGGNKRGSFGKTAVLGVLERDGRVVAKVVQNVKKGTLTQAVRESVEPGSVVYTDALSSYDGISLDYDRQVIDHQVAFAKGDVHINGIENFWSLFKRCIKGTYIHMNTEHLGSYVDEQTFRFNNRKSNDAERFALTVRQVSGKRVMYRDLIARKHG